MASKPKTKAKRVSASSRDKHGLEPRQRLFVEHYLSNGFNATQAGLSAGYAPASARSQVCELLKKPNIRAAVDAGKEAALEALGVSRERILGELAALAFSDIGDVFDSEHGGLRRLHEMSPGARAAISSVEVEQISAEGVSMGTVSKVKLWDKAKALETLGKHLKLWTEKVEHSGGMTLEQMVLGSMAPPEEEKP